MEKLDGFFKVRHNVIFERARFNMRNQLPGEAAEKYIAELYRLADNCNFGNFRDELIRDRLVVGLESENVTAAADGPSINSPEVHHLLQKCQT